MQIEELDLWNYKQEELENEQKFKYWWKVDLKGWDPNMP